MKQQPRHMGKRLLSLTLALVLALGTLSGVATAQQAPGNAPFINTWLVSGPFEEPVADLIYDSEGGVPLERPADGNWASLSTATASSQWQTNAYDYPYNSPSSSAAPSNAVDGDKGTEWISQMHNTLGDPSTWPVWDPEPTLWLDWPVAISVKTVQFYDRHNDAWPDPTSNVEQVECNLYDKNGTLLGTVNVANTEENIAIDPKGKTPGVADFGEEISGVTRVELKIIYDNDDKCNKNVGLGFTEVEVYDAVGPAVPEEGEEYNVNIAPNATVTASSTYPNNPVTYLVDGSTRRQWVSLDGGQDTEPWVMLTWDEPVSFNEIDLFQWGDGRHVNQYYDITVTFQDGTTTTGHLDSTNSSSSTPDVWSSERTLKNVVSVKVEVDKGRDPYPSITGISEMEVYNRPRSLESELPEDGNWASLATVSASDEFNSNYNAQKAVDGDLTNSGEWAANGTRDASPVLTLQWSGDIYVKRVEFLSRFADPGADDVTKVTVRLYNAQGELIRSDETNDPTATEPGVVVYDTAVTGVRKIEMQLTGVAGGNLGCKEVYILAREWGEGDLPDAPDPMGDISPEVGEAFGTASESHDWEYFDDRIYNRNYDDYQDLSGYFTTRKGVDTKNKYVYASTYIYSPERQQAQLRVGASGSYRIYFNDVLKTNSTVPAEVQKDMTTVSVVLEKGWNKLLIQILHTYTEDCVINSEGTAVPVAKDQNVWYLGFYARVTDGSGNAIDGVFTSVMGNQTDSLEIVTQGLSSEETTEDGLGLPESNMPTAYREWPYVWNKSTTSNSYGLSASAFQFQAAGGQPPYKWEVVGGTLPDNLVLSENGSFAGSTKTGSALLSDNTNIIPATCAEGDFTFTVKVTDAAGNTATKQFTIPVKERPNKWFEEGRVGALSHCITIPQWEVDPNFSADLWAERAMREGHSLVSIEAGQQHYYWPSKFNDPDGINQNRPNKWYYEDGELPDGLKVFEEAVRRYGMKFGLYYPGRGTDMMVQDTADLIQRYSPDYIYYDGPQGFKSNNYDVIYSNIRNYSDEIIVNSNAWGEEYGDPDLGTHESSGIYANVGSNHFVKKVVFEPWKSVHSKNNTTPYYATRDDYRQIAKEMIMNAGRGYVDNNDQMPLMSRGVNWDSPQDVATRYPISLQEFIDIREGLASWFAPEGLPERHEATTGTTPYFLEGYGYEDDGEGNYDYFAHPSTSNTPRWGYAMSRDNNIYLHIIEGPDSKIGFDAIENNTLTISPVNGTVQSVIWLNENVSVSSFEQNGTSLTIHLDNVTEDPIDTIIKITTDSTARKYVLTDLYLTGEQLTPDSLQIVTEGHMTYPALKANLESVTYSSDSAAVSVSNTGVVTPVSDGTATITVTGTYEGVTVSDTIQVKSSNGMVYVGEEMLSAVLHVNDRETYGELYRNDEALLYVEGRASTGGPIGLDNAAITWHTGTVDLTNTDKYEAIKITETGDVMTVENGALVNRNVETKTRAVVWADVTLDGVTVTTNRVYLDLLPTDNMAPEADVQVSVNQEQAANLTDGKAIDGIEFDGSKWSAPAGTESWVEFSFQEKQQMTGLDIDFNTLNQYYYNTPKSFTVQTSEDGETWTDVQTFTGPTGHAWFGYYTSYEFSSPVETAYLRLVFNEGNSAQIDVLDVAIRGTYTAPKSSEKDILSFEIEGGETEINGTEITVTMPARTDVTALTPSITVSSKATVSPASGETKDFTEPVTYTVTAEDGTAKTYTVTVVVPVDKTALAALYDDYKDNEQGNYTDESWAAFQEALNNAKTVLDNENAAQEEVDAAETALRNAIGGLTEKPEPEPEPEVDKSALEDLYNDNKDKQQGDYTDDSWEDFQEALANAEAVLNDPDATQEEVDAAKAALRAAIDGLQVQEKPIFPVLPIIPGNSTTKPTEEMHFTDVNTGDWFYDDVKYVYDNGIMNGVSDTRFAPQSTLTRAMVVTILYRMEGEPSTRYNALFPDVENYQWYTKGVEWAANNGIVLGYTSGKFGPNDPVTREQLAAILYRYAQSKNYVLAEGSDLSAFADASNVSSYAVSAVKWSVTESLLEGADGKLLPRQNATRAEVAHAIAGFCQNVR